MIPLAKQRIMCLGAMVAAALAAGCLSRSYPQKSQYMLTAERVAPPAVSAAPPDAEPATGAGVLRVGRIRIAPKFERKGFVYRIDDNKYERDFYSEFFDTPSILVREATAVWLHDSPLFSNTVDASDPSQADWLIEGRVNELYADIRDPKAPTARLAVTFTLFDAGSPELDVALSQGYAVDVLADRASAPAILAAWNEALAQILSQLETDLRVHLTSKSAG